MIWAIAQTYHRLPSPTESVQLPIGSRWQAIVMASGDYAVRDEQDRLVCQGNFETGDVDEPMHSTKAEEFQRMVQGRSRRVSERESRRVSVNEAAPKGQGEARDRLRGELQK